MARTQEVSRLNMNTPQWFWISYADADRLRGVVIVFASTPLGAIAAAGMNGWSPRGQALVQNISEQFQFEAADIGRILKPFCNRLLDRTEAENAKYALIDFAVELHNRREGIATL